jgi:cell division protein FtsZ
MELGPQDSQEPRKSRAPRRRSASQQQRPQQPEFVVEASADEAFALTQADAPVSEMPLPDPPSHPPLPDEPMPGGPPIEDPPDGAPAQSVLPGAPATLFATEEPKTTMPDSRRSTPNTNTEHAATIKVIGIGGGGCNAVNRMVRAGLSGVEFYSVNSDVQALRASATDNTVHIGGSETRGLGAGANPTLGRDAATESREDLGLIIEGADLVFLTAGMGGGTGTGAAPVIAEIARESGALTIAVVTKPFAFEGKKRMQIAENGIAELEAKVDTLITIPNERILQVIEKKTPLNEAFAYADDVLRQGIQGISDLITQPGLINLDFADVKTIMTDAGSAMMGIGEGSGEHRAADAAQKAIASPLLETTIEGARGVIFNITGGPDMAMYEVNEAAEMISRAVDPDAQIIFGASIDPSMSGKVRVTVLAAGFGAPRTFRDTTSTFSAQRPERLDTVAPVNMDDIEVPAFLRYRG